LAFPTSDGPKRARIVEHPPTTRSGSYWYVLEVVDGPYPQGTRLRGAFARRRRDLDGLPVSEADPEERQTAIAKLTTWAQGNGWTVEA
jgi:hypothetical protein